MHNVVVIDEEFIKRGKDIEEICDSIDQSVDTYLRIMKKVRSLALKNGATAEAFSTYVSYAENLKGVLTRIAQHNKKATDDFVKEIDRADSYLF